MRLFKPRNFCQKLFLGPISIELRRRPGLFGSPCIHIVGNVHNDDLDLNCKDELLCKYTYDMILFSVSYIYVYIYIFLVIVLIHQSPVIYLLSLCFFPPCLCGTFTSPRVCVIKRLLFRGQFFT